MGLIDRGSSGEDHVRVGISLSNLISLQWLSLSQFIGARENKIMQEYPRHWVDSLADQQILPTYCQSGHQLFVNTKYWRSLSPLRRLASASAQSADSAAQRLTTPHPPAASTRCDCKAPLLAILSGKAITLPAIRIPYPVPRTPYRPPSSVPQQENG